MKLSSFSVILTFVILMIIGVALAPLIDVESTEKGACFWKNK